MTIAVVLLVIALGFFVFASIPVPAGRVNLVAVGLAFATLAALFGNGTIHT